MPQSTALNRKIRALVVGSVLMVACQPTAEVSTTTTLSATTVPDPAPPSESEVYEVLALTTHPNGTQLRIDRIEVLAESVVVSGAVINGSPFGITIHRGRTELQSDRGDSAPLLDRLETGTIDPAAETFFTLRFAALTDPGAVTLILNSGQGASPSNPSTSAPSFELGPIRLDASLVRPQLPEPVTIRRSFVASSGVELQVEGINFTENRIGVWVRISNPLTVEARIAPTIFPSQIVDDLGNRYPLVLPSGEGWISIPPGTARTGVLSFAGRIHSDASALDLGLNAGSVGRFDGNVVRPGLLAEDIPLTGETATAPLPDTLSLNEGFDHPTGVRAEISEATFTDSGIEVAFTLINSRGDSVAVASSPTYLIDDLGNRYPLIPLPDNPQLTVAAGTTVEASFVFSGRVAEDAGEISLIFNAGRSTDDPDTRQPSFSFGPYQLQRTGAAPEPVEARLFSVGAHSRLVADNIAVSQIDQITQTLTQFGATEVDGGFQLTLPDSILFDFSSSQLRPDAAPALTLIADVLRYFEGDQVIIVGHTDSIGSTSANQRLSEERAQTVLEALLNEHGIPADRLTAEGRGSTEPVAPNTTPDGRDNPEGRALNRRVEIIVLTTRPLPGR